uniref:(northern house mosquito) hypothetical protein n=1 Tax=Culex pipiens TaxID=7175 RepID=A0A8D8NBN0_CULPI
MYSSPLKINSFIDSLRLSMIVTRSGFAGMLGAFAGLAGAGCGGFGVSAATLLLLLAFTVCTFLAVFGDEIFFSGDEVTVVSTGGSTSGFDFFARTGLVTAELGRFLIFTLRRMMFF